MTNKMIADLVAGAGARGGEYKEEIVGVEGRWPFCEPFLYWETLYL